MNLNAHYRLYCSAYWARPFPYHEILINRKMPLFYKLNSLNRLSVLLSHIAQLKYAKIMKEHAHIKQAFYLKHKYCEVKSKIIKVHMLKCALREVNTA